MPRLRLAIALALSASACTVAPGRNSPLPGPVAAPAVAEPVATGAPPAPTHVARYHRFELTWPAAPGPLAAHDGTPSAEATFIAPSGETARVSAFDAGGTHHVRFAPREIGWYRYEVREWGPAGARLFAGRFESTPTLDPGPVRVDPRQPHRLAFDDGSPFFILGENRINIYDPTWNYGQKGIDDYVRAMADEGMTTLRFFVGADAVPEDSADTRGLGCLEPRLGEYDERVAARFDAIFEAAEAHGIYVILTAFAVGFTPHDAWKSWEDNPYSAARGGPASHPVDFFAGDAARELAARRLRYILARWGYSTHLLAIDLLNEPEWDGAIPESKWIPWASAMANSVRAADPYRHLLTVGSVGLQWNIDGDEEPLYAGATEDLVEWHLYGPKTYDPRANAVEMARKVRETYRYGKPVFCGEFAYGGEDPSLYDHTHGGIWAATFAGGGVLAHSAPPFNIDSDEPMTPERGRHFRVLSEFLRSIDWSSHLEPDARVRLTRPGGSVVFALGRDDTKAFWILGPARGYGSPVTGARLAVDGLAPEPLEVSFRDDVRGSPLGSVVVMPQGGRVSVDVPTFVRHVAGTIKRPSSR